MHVAVARPAASVESRSMGRRRLQTTPTCLHSSSAASRPPSGPCQSWRRRGAFAGATHSAPRRCSLGVRDARGTCPSWSRCTKRGRPQQGQWRRPVRPCARPEHGARDIRRGRGRGSWKCVGSPSRHRRRSIGRVDARVLLLGGCQRQRAEVSANLRTRRPGGQSTGTRGGQCVDEWRDARGDNRNATRRGSKMSAPSPKPTPPTSLSTAPSCRSRTGCSARPTSWTKAPCQGVGT